MSLRTSPPDLLITDVRLDGYNGLQLVIKRPADIPAIVITGFPDAVLESEAVRTGATYMEKPINPRDLLQLISRVLDT
jgi:DNA-binding NtrC family response regulator